MVVGGYDRHLDALCTFLRASHGSREEECAAGDFRARGFHDLLP
jgi:hypothetical protein